MPTRQSKPGRSVIQAIYVRRVTLKNGIPLTLIVAKETNPPTGKKAIEWKLITNRNINSFDKAATMIDCYRKRWQIEVLFHVLKTGCKIEERQFGCIETHERALLLYLLVSYRILLMTMLAKIAPKTSCELVFTRQEWQTAYRVRYRKKPPKTPMSLDEMVRVVAGFGGFLNRKSDKSPGVKTVWLGLRSLADYVVGASCG